MEYVSFFLELGNFYCWKPSQKHFSISVSSVQVPVQPDLNAWRVHCSIIIILWCWFNFHPVEQMNQSSEMQNTVLQAVSDLLQKLEDMLLAFWRAGISFPVA